MIASEKIGVAPLSTAGAVTAGATRHLARNRLRTGWCSRPLRGNRITKRTTEHIFAGFASTVDDGRVARLPDDPCSVAVALRAEGLILRLTLAGRGHNLARNSSQETFRHTELPLPEFRAARRSRCPIANSQITKSSSRSEGCVDLDAFRRPPNGLNERHDTRISRLLRVLLKIRSGRRANGGILGFRGRSDEE
jgi:hypothetical protein